MKLSDQIAEYESYGEHKEPLSAAVQALVDSEGLDAVVEMRFAPPAAHAPTNVEKLARAGNAEQFKELLRGVQEERKGGIYKADELDEKTLAAIYRSVMFPFIWFWRLPALSEPKVKNFAKHGTLWVQRYIPNGLAFMDHLGMIGVMLDGLWDCFQRRDKGEAAQWPRKKKATVQAGDDGTAA